MTINDLIGKKITSISKVDDLYLAGVVNEVHITLEDGTQLSIVQHDTNRWNYGDTFMTVEVTK